MYFFKPFKNANNVQIPFYSANIAAGFPSPCDPHLEKSLDIHEHLVKRPSSTFLTRAVGDSMILFGIRDRAILVVDKSLDPKDKDIVIATINNEMLIKEFRTGPYRLVPGNPKFPTIYIKNETDFEIWGVVTSVINEYRRG